MTRLIYLITCLPFLSCESSKVEHNDNGTSKDTIVTQPTVLFNQNDTVEILNFKKTNDYPSSEKDTTSCNNWNLSVEDIKALLKESEVINGPDWHHLFEHLPCSITGQLIQANKRFDFQINGGAWMTITDRDTTLYFGYFKKDSNRLFISTLLDSENEE